MTAPMLAAADARIAQTRRDIQKILHQRVDNAAQRVFADASFFEDTNVIPIRAAVIGQLVQAGQQLLVTHFNADLSRRLELPEPPRISPQVFERPGVDKTTEYSRPFYTSLQLVRNGKSEPEAMASGSRRLRVMSATDLQMAKVRQARIALKAGGRNTFRRVTSGNPCELCEIAADQIYYTEDLMPIHPGCSCDVEADEGNSAADEGDALTRADEDAQDSEDEEDKPDVDDIQVQEHGEIGPLLTWAKDSFTGPDDLPNPPDVIASPAGGEQRGPGVPASIYDRARAHLDALNLRLAQRAS